MTSHPNYQPDTETLLARAAAVICGASCGLVSECRSREAAAALLDAGLLAQCGVQNGDAWQPIETAPKVARRSVLVARPGAQAIRAYQDPVGAWWMHGDYRTTPLKGEYAPTHWMPLPTGPSLSSNVMAAAERAAEVVEGWSGAKKDYASRAVSSADGESDLETAHRRIQELQGENDILRDKLHRAQSPVGWGTELEPGVMAAAEKAAEVVDGWSDAKKDYAARAVASTERL